MIILVFLGISAVRQRLKTLKLLIAISGVIYMWEEYVDIMMEAKLIIADMGARFQAVNM